MEDLETKAQVTSYNIKFYLSIKTRKRGKPHGNKTSPKKWKWGQKYEGEWKQQPYIIQSN